MPDEIPATAAGPAPTSPVDRYAHGDPAMLAEAMLAPGEREPDIAPEGLEPDALKVIKGLRGEGFQAYLVGGCVRDLLVGLLPKDFDIATSAHPGEIRATFRNCRLIGRRFRLAHVYFRGGKIIEVATFRKNPNPVLAKELEAEAASAAEAHLEAVAQVAEGEADTEAAVESREPEADESPDLLITEDNTFGIAEEDAVRRDFTINGLFYDVVLGRVLDYVGGLRDLARGQVRTIGDPEVRMREDPVRLLRAVRFACKLGFEIEPMTYAACEGAVEDLGRCAPPRLLEECFKILRAGSSAPAFKLLDALGATPVLLPALDKAMKQGGPGLERDVQALLAQVDARITAGGPLDDALLFAALLEPINRRSTAAEGADEPVEALLEDLVRGSRLPRRIADRVRHLLAAQKTLSGERKRRRSLSSFKRTPYFADALELFALRVAATGQGTELLAQWRSGVEPELPTTATDSVVESSSSDDSIPAESVVGEVAAESSATGLEVARKKRRRRRGRGGGGKGEGSGNGNGSGTTPTPGADS
jgi:poly(A) polymerase